MKLTFNFNIKSLDGKPLQGDVNAARILANILSQMNKGNAIKLWDWAQKLWNKAGIEIDDTDSKVLEALIDNNENLPIITKAQLLEHIEEVRKKSK